MELSPRLLRDVEFGEQWRGYNQAEVDEFLERVAAALESLVQRFQETTARAEAAERRLLERGEDDEIRRTLVLAQRTAAAAVEEARAEAERIVAAAEAAAAERVAAADARLQEVEHEIDERTKAEIAGLEARRQALAADVDALGAFVDEHRNRLAGELRRELSWLERPELTVPQPPRLQASPPVTAAPASPPPAPAPVAPEERVAPPTPEETAAAQSLADAAPEPQPAGPAGGDDDDLAAAREELERALAGVDDEPSSDADASAGRQVFDVLADDDAEEQPGEPTGLFDVLRDDDDDDDLAVHWRDEEPEAPRDVDDDPFLTELRKAITDDDPLGPRDHDPHVGGDSSSEAAGSGWFRLRRPRG